MSATFEGIHRMPADDGFSYPETGATRHEPLPGGYRHVRHERVIGAGPDLFRRAAAALDGWAVHRGAGLRVAADGPATAPGIDVRLGIGVGPLRLTAVCRVIYVIREPGRHGFAYGTLRHHPERGEESFVLSLDDSGRTTFTITAFSRPASLTARLSGPLGTAVQDLVTRRYLSAMHRLAG
ncbi:DUF1990 family protein [Catenuloplanes sp. NPDC051500]|uniref:DUF1990 family protein n=1 Tax=Catenuloplanes sp. NPDC051500 TaxID=3363959 RepID=UPI0037AA234D